MSYGTCLSDLLHLGFPGGASGKEPACQCRTLKQHGGEDTLKEGVATHSILPGESYGQRSLVDDSPEDLPHPGIEPGSPALQVDSLPS